MQCLLFMVMVITEVDSADGFPTHIWWKNVES